MEFSIYDLIGTLEEITETFKEYQDRFIKQGYSSLNLDLEDSYDDTRYVLKGKRLETDEEVRRRLARRKMDRLDKTKQEEEPKEKECQEKIT
jgi:hypothetical protein